MVTTSLFVSFSSPPTQREDRNAVLFFFLEGNWSIILDSFWNTGTQAVRRWWEKGGESEHGVDSRLQLHMNEALGRVGELQNFFSCQDCCCWMQQYWSQTSAFNSESDRVPSSCLSYQSFILKSSDHEKWSSCKYIGRTSKMCAIFREAVRSDRIC